MDADCQERRRDFYLSQREKRWSMNSQRLEEIVAELMKPISDVRRSFDTDLSALLEEYLTEAGLHALDAEEDEPRGPAPGAVNFAELALLLQHSASVYGRKVDLLYQRVLDVSDSLLNTTQEVEASSSAGEPATPSSRRKRRASAAAAGFDTISVAGSAAARREPAAPRPPPTLPRIYIELEPRAMADCDAPLTDYEGEPVGLLADFHVTWRLQEGVLVDELEGSGARAAGSLRPIPLSELSAALAAHAPPDPPPRCSTPLPAPADPGPPPAPADPPPEPGDDAHDSAIEMTPVAKCDRKRKCETKIEDVGRIKMLISKALRRELATAREFSVAAPWVDSVLRARTRRIRALRGQLRDAAPALHTEFRGFDYSTACEVGGFRGWSDAEGARATELARGSLRPLDNDSDDDGFFEQSSLGDSDASRAGDTTPHTHTHLQPESESEAWSEWQRGVLQRAAQGEARALDVRALADRLMDALPGGGEPERFPIVLTAAKAEQHDVSGLFLATLFLANSGNVEVLPGRALELNSFCVRLVSRDQRRLSAAAAAAAADGIAPRS